MKKITFSIALSVITLASVAQKTVLVNGGRYGNQAENVTVSVYDTQTGVSTTIDTIQTQSVQDVLVDGNIAFVAAQDSIVRYNLSNNTRTAAVKFAGASTKSLALAANNELIVSNWYGRTSNNVYIYNQTTLNLLDSINIPSGVTSMLVVPANDLLIVNQNQSTGAPNYQDTLGSIIAATISNRTVIAQITTSGYSGDVGQLIAKPSGIGAYAFNSVSNTIIDVDAATFPLVTTTLTTSNQNFKLNGRSHYEVNGDTLFLRMNQGIGAMNLSNLALIDSNLVDTVVTAFAYDTTNFKFYVTATDFFSYTSGKIYDRVGNYSGTFATASSPEAIAMNYNQTTGILVFSTKENISFSVYPNPATNQFSVDAELSTETVIQILNYKGQLVKEVHQLNASNQIDINYLSSGIYFVNLITNNTVSTQKLMVK
tara:strand:- start:57660 stop:58940 length:1281 start_codon:yes stop_codon:yes gene_type:complete